MVSRKSFQFLATMLPAATLCAFASMEQWGFGLPVALLYGTVIGWLAGEMWVASLLHGEEKHWTWFPVLRGRLRKRVT
jgi:hypothetical protein